jgi:chromosome partitioning protein
MALEVGMRQIIAITNEKGGVAKTTTTLSLGGALVEGGKEVLLIDLDAQANLTIGLGVNPAKSRHSIADVLLNAVSLLSASRETAIPGLDLVPSCPDMLLAERFLTIRQDYERILSGSLATLTTYDYVLLDCPPSLGAVSLNAMIAAGMVIIPTQPEYFSVNGLRGVLNSIRKVRNQYNPLLYYKVLITMLDRRNRIHNTLSNQIRKTFGEGVFDTCIETDTKLRESTVVGLPITHYFPRSRSAGQYRALAQELIEHADRKTAQPA